MCSLEEIELKRRLAQEKLARKGLSPLKSETPSSASNTSSLLKAPRFSFKDQNSSSNHHTKPYDKPGETKFTKPYDKPEETKFSGTEKVVTAKCSLISEDRFVVELSGFSTPCIDIFKTIASRHYNVQTRNWDFHLQHHDEVVSKLHSLKPQVVVERVPKFVLNCMSREKSDFSSIDLSCLDPELGGALMPFQQEGVRFGIDKKGRCLIADDMGLGKTFQALGIANYYINDWPLLIVTTASMKNIWEQTIHQYLPSVPMMHVQYMTSGKDYIGDARILIVSHDMMTRCVESLRSRQFGVLIVDESHNLKNLKAKCTKAATALAKIAKRVILLSGTPALSRPCELYSQLSLIDGRFFGNFYDYSRRYCDGRNTNFGWDASGKSNLQELEIILSRRFMIRRTKDEVLKTLPNKTQEVVTLNIKLDEFSEEDKKCLQDLANKFESHKKSSEKHAILLTFFSETAKIKIASVCSYILQTLKANQKFLVFAHHQIMLDAICNILQKKDVKYIRIDGNTTSEQRKYFVDKFQTNEKFMVAVLSITAANAGITLTAAQLVLFAELHWNPSILSQAESRAHRIGQLNPVVIRYLLAPGTADDKIWPMLQQKQKILEEVGLSKQTFTNVTISEQTVSKQENLSTTLNRTCANTLDITSYFHSKSDNKGDTSDIFDDGLDEFLCNIDM